MQVKNVPIPGNNIQRYNGPWIEIQGEQDQRINLIIRYDKYPGDDWIKLHCALTFTGVLEYRFKLQEIEYDDFAELKDHDLENRKLRAEDPTEIHLGGLLEIQGSPYAENMITRGRWKYFMTHIPKKNLKHYRISFDEYGRFDILALGVSVTVEEESLAHLRPDSTGL
jgi:hypothetical protein